MSQLAGLLGHFDKIFATKARSTCYFLRAGAYRALPLRTTLHTPWELLREAKSDDEKSLSSSVSRGSLRFAGADRDGICRRCIERADVHRRNRPRWTRGRLREGIGIHRVLSATQGQL